MPYLFPTVNSLFKCTFSKLVQYFVVIDTEQVEGIVVFGTEDCDKYF